MEADISTWRKTGHFYFALTREATAGDDKFFEDRIGGDGSNRNGWD